MLYTCKDAKFYLNGLLAIVGLYVISELTPLSENLLIGTTVYSFRLVRHILLYAILAALTFTGLSSVTHRYTHLHDLTLPFLTNPPKNTASASTQNLLSLKAKARRRSKWKDRIFTMPFIEFPALPPIYAVSFNIICSIKHLCLVLQSLILAYLTYSQPTVWKQNGIRLLPSQKSPVICIQEIDREWSSSKSLWTYMFQIS